MQIVLSAHFDLARPVPYLTLDTQGLHGLIDNFAGVFVAYEAARKTGVPLYLTNFEETGMKGAREVVRRGELFRAPSRPWLTKKQWRADRLDLDGASQKASRTKHHKPTVVIVVDTTRDAGSKPAYIGNVYNFDIEPLQKKFVKEIFFMPGYVEETEDETWVYGHTFTLPCFYFGVPIPLARDYHDLNNTISLATLDRNCNILTKLVKFIKSWT